MNIELIDLDTGDTMEVPKDKVNHPAAGLQFSGEPTERALLATDAIQKFLTKDNTTWLHDHACAIFQALSYMAEERR
jgi:hypothetical protein